MREIYHYRPTRINDMLGEYRARFFPGIEKKVQLQLQTKVATDADLLNDKATIWLSKTAQGVTANAKRAKTEMYQDLGITIQSANNLEESYFQSPGIHFPSYVRMQHDHVGYRASITMDPPENVLIIGALSVTSICDFAHISGFLNLEPTIIDIEGDQTARYAKELGIPFLWMNGERLGFPNRSFDVIMTHGLMPYLRTKERMSQVIAEGERVLRPGGAFYLVEDAQYSASDLDEQLSLDIRELLIDRGLDVSYVEADEISRRAAERQFDIPDGEQNIELDTRDWRDDPTMHLIFAWKFPDS